MALDTLILALLKKEWLDLQPTLDPTWRHGTSPHKDARSVLGNVVTRLSNGRKFKEVSGGQSLTAWFESGTPTSSVLPLVEDEKERESKEDASDDVSNLRWIRETCLRLNVSSKPTPNNTDAIGKAIVAEFGMSFRQVTGLPKLSKWISEGMRIPSSGKRTASTKTSIASILVQKKGSVTQWLKNELKTVQASFHGEQVYSELGKRFLATYNRSFKELSGYKSLKKWVQDGMPSLSSLDTIEISASGSAAAQSRASPEGPIVVKKQVSVSRWIQAQLSDVNASYKGERVYDELGKRFLARYNRPFKEVSGKISLKKWVQDGMPRLSGLDSLALPGNPSAPKSKEEKAPPHVVHSKGGAIMWFVGEWRRMCPTYAAGSSPRAKDLQLLVDRTTKRYGCEFTELTNGVKAKTFVKGLQINGAGYFPLAVAVKKAPVKNESEERLEVYSFAQEEFDKLMATAGKHSKQKLNEQHALSELGGLIRRKFGKPPGHFSGGMSLSAWLKQPPPRVLIPCEEERKHNTASKQALKSRKKPFRNRPQGKHRIYGERPTFELPDFAVMLAKYDRDKKLYKKIVGGRVDVDAYWFNSRLEEETELMLKEERAQTIAGRQAALLIANSTQSIAELHKYDIPNAKLSRRGKDSSTMFELEVKGLAEKRPSLLVGDTILAHHGDTTHTGFIHQARLKSVLVSFGKSFDPNLRYDIEFVASRTSHRLMMRAVEGTDTSLPWVTDAAMRPTPTPMTLESTRFELVYAEQYDDIESACEELLDASPSVVGFDMEWDPHFYKYHEDCTPDVPAVIQLAYSVGATRRVLVLHVFDSRYLELPASLQKVLINDRYLKVGVGVFEHDVPKLIRYFEWAEDATPSKNGFEDLQVSVRIFETMDDKNKTGLKTMTRELLNMELSKAKRMFLWHQSLLAHPEQQEYAALDAVAALLIHTKVDEQKRKFHGTSSPIPLPFFGSLRDPNASRSAPNYIKRQSLDEMKIEFLNKSLVDEQKEAVAQMCGYDRSLGACGDGSNIVQPLIIFGPPGTGKTTTLAEGVLQLLFNSQHKREKILICTPTNAAADQIAAGIVQGSKPVRLLRFNAYGRHPKDVLPELTKCTLLTSDGSGFHTPPLNVTKDKFDVIVSTNHNAGKLVSLGMERGWFTTVILDEASQAMQPESLIPLSLADTKTNIVLAGDPKQLGAVIQCRAAQKNGLGISLLEVLIEAAGNDAASVVQLRQSFRAHESIMNIYSKMFYDNKLVSRAPRVHADLFVDSNFLPNPKFPILFIHVEHDHEFEEHSPSVFNSVEIEEVVETLRQVKQAKPELLNSEIGVISPYRLQVTKLRQKMKEEKDEAFDGILVDVTERFQGAEKAVIVLSIVRSQMDKTDIKCNLGFLTDPKRLNVAISRPRSLLVIVGNAKTLIVDRKFRQLVSIMLDHDAIRFNGLSTSQELQERILHLNKSESV